jgi:hydrogenase maturation protease
MQQTIKPILVFTWGNPSRGDDSLGPEVYDLLVQENLNDVDLLTDFQLQIEHAIDLENREGVLFVDASANARPPFEFYPLSPSQDQSYTTHAMSPQALLAVYDQINHQPQPEAFMLSIRGYEFGLGLPLSSRAAANLTEAIAFIRRLLTETPIQDWAKLTRR